MQKSRAGVRKADVLKFQRQARLSNKQLARGLHITARTWQGYDANDIMKSSVAERTLALAQLYAKGVDFMEED